MLHNWFTMQLSRVHNYHTTQTSCVHNCLRATVVHNYHTTRPSCVHNCLRATVVHNYHTTRPSRPHNRKKSRTQLPHSRGKIFHKLVQLCTTVQAKKHITRTTIVVKVYLTTLVHKEVVPLTRVLVRRTNMSTY